MLRLYYTPGTCARASHIALAEAATAVHAVFALTRVDFASAEQRSPAYLALNPKGRVPLLETDDGYLTETPAILAYVAQRFADANLAPLSDPYRFAKMQEFNSYLCATVHVAHAHGRRGERWADESDAIEAMRRKAPANFGACFDLIESHYLASPWVMGDHYTVADGYLFTLTQWLPSHGIDLERYPNVAAHHARMQERPAVRAALAAEA